MADIMKNPSIKNATREWRSLLAVASSCLIVLGLFLCSFPEEHHEWAKWSASIATIGNKFMAKGGELSRYVHSAGAQFLILGIQFSGVAKQVLSGKVLGWMGKNSFAVYLIHPLFIRTVLVWIMYGVVKLPHDLDDDGTPMEPGILIWYKGYGTTFAALTVFYLVLYVASDYWTTCVEAWCSRVLGDVETLVFTTKATQSNRTSLLPK